VSHFNKKKNLTIHVTLVSKAFLLFMLQRYFLQQTHRRNSQEQVLCKHHNYVSAMAKKWNTIDMSLHFCWQTCLHLFIVCRNLYNNLLSGSIPSNFSGLPRLQRL